MGLARIIANRRLSKYRIITESNLKRSQVFLKSNKLANDPSLRLTIECSEYLMINSYDLFVLSYNYLASKRIWDKLLYSRIIALYLIDFYDKIFPLIGKEVIPEIKNITDSKTIETMKLLCKKISAIKIKSESTLRHVRNVTIAHKTNSGFQLYDEIYKIEHKTINDYASDLSGLMTSLNAQLTDVLRSYIKTIK
jgi:hypothetical protein